MRCKMKPRTSQGFAAFFLIPFKLILLGGIFAIPPQSLWAAEFENSLVVEDAVGTIGYRDNHYFTVVLKPDFSPEGEVEIGFFKTDELQLPPMVSWSEITPGLAVRVSYEELRSSEKARMKGVESQWTAVLERKAIKLVIGQKPQRKVLAS